jgi:hypothetical protein
MAWIRMKTAMIWALSSRSLAMDKFVVATFSYLEIALLAAGHLFASVDTRFTSVGSVFFGRLGISIVRQHLWIWLERTIGVASGFRQLEQK